MRQSINIGLVQIKGILRGLLCPFRYIRYHLTMYYVRGILPKMTVGTAEKGNHPMTTPSISVKHETALQVVHYLKSKAPSATKINIVKMAYLADKLHLLHYARTITHDEYFALPLGPIGSNVLNICNLDDRHFNRDTVAYAKQYLEVKSAKDIAVKHDMEHDLLSETDIEMLNQAISKFESGVDLVEFLHTFPEWTKFKADLESGRTKKKPISLESMFALPKEPLGVSEEEARESKEIAAEVC